jgi:hypothetical protein
MAALREGDLWGSFLSHFRAKPRFVADSRKARDFSNRVYKEMGGPTPRMKQFYANLLENERRAKQEG